MAKFYEGEGLPKVGELCQVAAEHLPTQGRNYSEVYPLFTVEGYPDPDTQTLGNGDVRLLHVGERNPRNSLLIDSSLILPVPEDLRDEIERQIAENAAEWAAMSCYDRSGELCEEEYPLCNGEPQHCKNCGYPME